MDSFSQFKWLILVKIHFKFAIACKSKRVINSIQRSKNDRKKNSWEFNTLWIYDTPHFKSFIYSSELSLEQLIFCKQKKITFSLPISQTKFNKLIFYVCQKRVHKAKSEMKCWYWKLEIEHAVILERTLIFFLMHGKAKVEKDKSNHLNWKTVFVCMEIGRVRYVWYMSNVIE